MFVLRCPQKLSVHWHFLHSADGVYTGCGLLFRSGRWACGYSIRAQEDSRSIRLPQWAFGLLYGRKSDVSRGHVFLVSDGGYQQVLLSK